MNTSPSDASGAAVSSHDPVAERVAGNAPWLVRLRWVAVAGQLITIAIVAWGLKIPLPLVPLGVALSVTAVTNLALSRWVTGEVHGGLVSGRTAMAVVAVVMLLDLLVLTGMLYVTGGATNPFIVFYLVNMALAGVLVEAPLAWLLQMVAVGGIGLLFWNHWQIPALQDPNRLVPLTQMDEATLAGVGEFVALVACSAVIVAFMTRLTHELYLSDQARRLAEERRSRSEKIEALGTLAAGAAHELATPLSTIAVVATEVERELATQPLPEEIGADLQLIRSELQRCRAILDRMAIDSGQLIAEPAVEIATGALVDEIVAGLSPGVSVTTEMSDQAREVRIHVPPVALAQALRGLVQNAHDAAPSETVLLKVGSPAEGGLRFCIIDQGPGMPAEVLARAGEPFFTTKPPGQGMGLGLFLARSVVERLGGRLELHSTPGVGTRAVVRLPMLP